MRLAAVPFVCRVLPPVSVSLSPRALRLVCLRAQLRVASARVNCNCHKGKQRRCSSSGHSGSNLGVKKPACSPVSLFRKQKAYGITLLSVISTDVYVSCAVRMLSRGSRHLGFSDMECQGWIEACVS